VGGQHHAPAALPPVKTRYPLYRRLSGPQGRSGRVRKISPPPGFDPRTVQPVVSYYTDWATRTGQIHKGFWYLYEESKSIVYSPIRNQPHVLRVSTAWNDCWKKWLLSLIMTEWMLKDILLLFRVNYNIQRAFSPYKCGPGSSVSIAIGYGLDGPGFESRWGRDFPHLSRPVLGPTQPPVQWVFSGGRKRPGRNADPSPLLVPRSKNRAELYLFSP
jgi:hypothetical protein